MKDHYPAGSAIPGHWLVSPSLQPDYPEVFREEVGDYANVGWSLSDGQVLAGRGDAVAMVHSDTGRSYTFRALAEESDRLARALVGWGIRPGDRIAFRGPNVPEILVAMMAAWKSGAAVVPTPVQSRAEELRFFLTDTAARLLIVVGGPAIAEDVPAAVDGTDVECVLEYGDDAKKTEFRHVDDLPGYGDDQNGLPPLPSIPSDSVAVVWHTGGTTGQPKGCYHTHRRFLLGGYAVGEVIQPVPGERWAAAAPVGHALGFIYHTIFTLLHGATIVIIEDFRDPRKIIEAINDHHINTFTAIAATWARMLEVLDRFSLEVPSLKRAYAMWQSASSTEVRHGWQARGLELINNYGSTAFATWPLVPRHDETFPPASLGKPLPGYEVLAVRKDGDRVLPVTEGPGQMAVRGPTGLTYWNRPELQRRDVVDGWSLCDDLIEFNDSGNAAYLGRTDYMISTAGYKVAPAEVESVLGAHPAVSEVAVVGAPCPVRQEMVVAFVSLNEGVEPGEELARELQDFVKARLSPYKYPRRVHFVPSLPRDAVGKIRGRVLKDWATAGSTDPQSPQAPGQLSAATDKES